MSDGLIKNARIVNEGRTFDGSILIQNGRIHAIFPDPETLSGHSGWVVDAAGRTVIPGVIDAHVHFREPGLTHKGDIHSESRAAVAGGITSFMEMPNTLPQTTSLEELEKKHAIAAGKSLANFGFYLGGTNDNIGEIRKLDPGQSPGIKVFIGSSTGGMLIDKRKSLESIFAESPVPVAAHCEDEGIIRKQSESYRQKYGEDVPIACHPEIRNEEACYRATARAIDLALKYGTKLHVLHLSTGKELGLLDKRHPVEEKQVTGEVCVHHLWFTQEDYAALGTRIKWNPAVKTPADREGLRRGLAAGTLDTVVTDHAPHTLEEKSKPYFRAPSGGPLVQHALPAMMEGCKQGWMDLPLLVEKMCHAPARIFRVRERGFIRAGYHADLVILEDAKWKVSRENLLYKCGWSPFEGQIFGTRVALTLVNGNIVYRWDDHRQEHSFPEGIPAMRLQFNR